MSADSRALASTHHHVYITKYLFVNVPLLLFAIYCPVYPVRQKHYHLRLYISFASMLQSPVSPAPPIPTTLATHHQLTVSAVGTNRRASLHTCHSSSLYYIDPLEPYPTAILSYITIHIITFIIILFSLF